MVAPTKFSAAPVLGSDNLILAAYGGGPDFSVGWVRSANATMTAKTKTTATEITIIRRPESRSLFSADGWSRPPMQSIVLFAPKRGSWPVTDSGHEHRGTTPTARLRGDDRDTTRSPSTLPRRSDHPCEWEARQPHRETPDRQPPPRN